MRAKTRTEALRPIIDNATFTDPHQLSTGVRDVWINGQRVLADGEHTGATPGQMVRRNE